MTKKKAAKKSNVSSSTAVAARGTKVTPAKAPQFRTNPDGSSVIAHMEYVADISATTGQGSTFLQPLNPQRSAVFTWLSSIAARYEMYRFKKLKFHYKPSSSTASGGYVIVGFDFDSLDYTSVTPPSKPEMLAWKYAVKCAVWQEVSLDVSADAKMSTFRYCDETFGARGDDRLDNLGLIIVRAFNPTTTTFVGELFVEYVVEFRQPAYKIPPALYLNQLAYNMTSLTDWLGGLSATATNLGNLTFEKLDERTLRILDVGSFLITTLLQAGTTVGTPTITFTTPITSPTADYTATTYPSANSGTNAISQHVLDVRVPPVQLQWSGGAGTGTILNSIRISTTKQ